QRVVARLAEQAEPRPGAAGAALVGVVAALAVAPEIVDGAVAHVAQRRRPLPDVAQRGVADVAAGPGHRLQRRTALDGAVGLDAQRAAAGPARRRVTARHPPAQRRFVGTRSEER